MVFFVVVSILLLIYLKDYFSGIQNAKNLKGPGRIQSVLVDFGQKDSLHPKVRDVAQILDSAKLSEMNRLLKLSKEYDPKTERAWFLWTIDIIKNENKFELYAADTYEDGWLFIIGTTYYKNDSLFAFLTSERRNKF